MWRMKRLAGVLLLAVLLLCNEVTSQDDATAAPAVDPPADGSAVTDAPASPDAADPVVTTGSGPAAPATAATASAAPALDVGLTVSSDDNSGTVVTATSSAVSVAAELVEMPANIECVTEDKVLLANHVHTMDVTTDDCEDSKRLLSDAPFTVKCERNRASSCQVQLFQDGNKLKLLSPNYDSDDAKNAEMILQSKGVEKNSSSSSSSGSSVFVGILVSGLLAAIGLTVGYFKCQRRSEGKEAVLVEEAHPTDQQNQGNTLVSVAPLNPPPETEEKPNINGETPDAVKTETPPTNGHSATKTADTEL